MTPSAASSAVNVAPLYCTQSITSGSFPLLRTDRNPARLPLPRCLRPREKSVRPPETHLFLTGRNTTPREFCEYAGSPSPFRVQTTERELGPCGLQGSTAEHLTRDFHLRTQFQYIFTQFVQPTYTDGAEILCFCSFFNLFHTMFLFISITIHAAKLSTKNYLSRSYKFIPY